jgi:transglutaminase-like putative cysteine protease
MLLMSCAIATGASGAEFDIAPPPAWAESTGAATEFAIPFDRIENGVYYLLNDAQVRIEGDSRVTFVRHASTAVNRTGVETIANIAIDFAPEYQRLTLHAIDVIRSGQRRSRLDPGQVRLLQRAQELDRLVFDSSMTASIFLDDVQVGDVVEYAFSVRGANPVFQGTHFGRFGLQWSVPVLHDRSRLLVPLDRDIRIEHRSTDLRPRQSERDGYRDYRWEQHDVAEKVIESDAPGWYQPRPSIQWTEFRDWNAVARWAARLYDARAAHGPRARQVAADIAARHATRSDQLLAALRFVQSEIRYLSMQIGEGSHAPHPPDLVLERRFGDCKDKTLLLLTLLDLLGIEARGALVHTQLGEGIADWLPSPGAFDHVLVQARVDGERYWLDPTRPPQGSNLDRLVQPDFGVALLIDPASHVLTPMQAGPHVPRRHSIHVIFDMSGGSHEPVPFTVSTLYEGHSAEWARNYLASSSREDLQRAYLNFYANYYPDISRLEPMQVMDDEARNHLRVTEFYQIANLWEAGTARDRIDAAIFVPDLLQHLHGPSSPIREAPIELPHPFEVKHTTEVLLDDTWSFEPDYLSVEDAAFELVRIVEPDVRRLVLSDTFRTLSDRVAAADVPRYVASLKRARESLDYGLYMSGPGIGDPQVAGMLPKPSVIAFAGAMLLLWIWLAMRFYRYDPAAAQSSVNPRLAGIRGWLILPAIGVVLSPIVLIVTLVQNLELYGAEQWTWLTDAASEGYDALWEPVLLFELAANLGLLVFFFLLAVMFFQRRRAVPRLYLAMLVASPAVIGLDLWLVSQVPSADLATAEAKESLRDFVRGIAQLLIWGTYFLVSRRVQATFTRTLDEPTSAPAPVAAA